ncbi:ABC transporter permease subunit [Spiroplasma culicicola]|uniref:Ribose/galactose ABC transporter permease n=1 Tax=Spiroplasma culicicola AES-1 TaxID=1276246 RepID=W6A6F8_9MOLU|nr:hypothetical protein [Spiroplasma culicicola]AHI52440.1 ribose/galactose ABC transporter permease [Spiroplasma culicicola AES-1]
MKFKLKTWVRNMKLNAQLNSPEIKKTASFFKTSVISILVGTILTMLLIAGLGANPIAFFIKSFDVVFTRDVNLQNAFSWFAVYGLFAIGLAIGFKVGLFNMSGSGQAILSMGITGLMLISLFGNTQVEINKAGSWVIILIFIVMVTMSMLLSSITGILKVFFNIHEVATSILLNWTVWYLMKWAFGLEGFISSSPRIPTEWIALAGIKWLIPIILMTLVFVATWFILTFTTLGYKFKLVGTQKDAAHYVGINYKKYIISATAIQGFCIGIGSFVYWCAIKGQYSLGNDIIPTIGFDAIAISLIAFNNILGILPISFLWAILTVGMPVAVTSFNELGREIAPLIFGFIVYASTFASLFARLQPMKWIRFSIYYFRDIPTQIEIKNINKQIKDIKQEIKNINRRNFENHLQLKALVSEIEKNIEDIKDLKFELNNTNKLDPTNESKIKELKDNFSKLVETNKRLSEQFEHSKKEIIIVLNRHIKQLKGDIQYLKDSGSEKYFKSSYYSIKSSFKFKTKRNAWDLLNPAVKDLNAIEEEKINILLEIKRYKKAKFNSELKFIKEVKAKYKLDLKQLKTEYQLNIKKIANEIKSIKKEELENKDAQLEVLRLKIVELTSEYNQKIDSLSNDLNQKLVISDNQRIKFAKQDEIDRENKIVRLAQLHKDFEVWKEKEQVLNQKWAVKIANLKETNVQLMKKKEENWILAKTELISLENNIKVSIENTNNQIKMNLENETNEQRILDLKLENKEFIVNQKAMRYEKILELGEKYGCN